MSMTTRTSRRPNVAIFGVGPAGLVAAHAIKLWGGKASFFANTAQKSKLFGCQYLHKPIRGLPEVGQAPVEYRTIGTGADYRRKVYGDRYNGPVSPERYAGAHTAWDLRDSYAKLWDMHAEVRSIAPMAVSPERISGTADAFREAFDFVISTVPAWNLCLRPEEHTFQSQRIYAAGDAPEKGIRVPVQVEDGSIICNGDPDVSWYRASRVFGHTTVEWSDQRKPPYEGVALVEKPLWSDCNCFPWIHRLGRYGSWRKSILVHDVFEQAETLAKVFHEFSMVNIRHDLCVKCGFFATTERPLIEPRGEIEYRCGSGHVWSGHGKSKSGAASG